MAGLNVRIGSINPEIKQNTTVSLPNGESVTLEPVQRVKGRLIAQTFRPLHHFAEQRFVCGRAWHFGRPARTVFVAATARKLAGAAQRAGTFASYEEVAKRFGKLLGVDPWLINPMFGQCGEVDFSQDSGMDCLRSNVDALLTKFVASTRNTVSRKSPLSSSGRQRGCRRGAYHGARCEALDVLQAGARQNASAANEVIISGRRAGLANACTTLWPNPWST